MTIVLLYPIHLKLRGPGYACHSIVEGMRSAGVGVELFCITAEAEMQRPYHRYAMPPWGKSLGYRLFSQQDLDNLIEWRYRRAIAKGGVAYIWPNASMKVFEQARIMGKTIVTEKINTHQSTSRVILDTEYRRLGLAPSHGLDEVGSADEDAKLRIVDFVFSPSEEVTKSLLQSGVPMNKVIGTSYGLDASDILPVQDVAARASRRELNALFVGRIGIRKGAHLLLDYWVKSGVKGTLKLVGNIEPDAKNLILPYFERSDIKHVPYTMDLKSLYREADVYLFPSLEEGSPLVTYLSLGAGLPSLVSPMGGGGVIRHGIDGLVLDPHDEDGWVKGIQHLFGDMQVRENFGSRAYQQAQQYLWPIVGRQRLESLRARMIESDRGSL
jgi:glycosyltransferase involved in cell wall biosynthesis